MPFATIIIPTYNQAHFLGAALDSVLAQTDTDWEAVVVNDGSTDDTASVLSRYATSDERIRQIHQVNGGVGAALNQGLAAARGEWIHWLSSDDLFEPDKLAINRRWIGLNPHADFFYSLFKLLRHSSGVLEERDLWGPRPVPNLEVLGLLYRNFVNGISICVRRERWETVGVFAADLRYGQDYDMWLRLLVALKPCFIPERTVISRNHEAQGSEQFPAACYYDSARAALRLLNGHSFRELVPWANLEQPDEASAAFEQAMATAADPTSFLYRLGPNPALAGRLLEWLSQAGTSEPMKALGARFRQRAAALAVAHADNDFGKLWATLSYAAAVDTDPCPGPTDSAALAVQRLARLSAAGAEEASDLARYVAGFAPATVNAGPKCFPATILLLTQEPGAACAALAATLTRRGHLVVRMADRFGTDAAGLRVPLLSAADDAAWLLPRLGPFDLVVNLGGDERHRYCIADQWLAAAADSPDLIAAVEAKLPRAAEGGDARTTVMLFSYTDRGGGAERVLEQLCRRLDRSRYAVEVLTLYRSGLPRAFPPAVRVRCISDSTDDIVAAHLIGVAETSPSTPLTGELVDVVAALIPQEIRALGHRVGISRSIVALLRAFEPLRQRTPHVLRAARGAAGRLRRAQAATERSAVGIADAIEPSTAAASARATLANSALGQRVRDVLRTLPAGARIVTFMEHAVLYTATLAPEKLRNVVASFHTHESNYLPIIFPDSGMRSYVETIFAKVSREARACAFPSAGCVRDFREHYAAMPANVHVLENPVDAGRIRFLAGGECDAEIERWIGERPLIVSLARLDAEKNHEALLAALALLAAQQVDFAVLCIGAGQRFEALRALSVELGLTACVRFTGAMDNPFPWLGRARALVLTSHFEAFALVLVEAMALGVTPVAIDCPFGPREVLRDGERGLLVPADDANALAGAIHRALTDAALRERLRLAAEGAITEYHPVEYVRKLENYL